MKPRLFALCTLCSLLALPALAAEEAEPSKSAPIDFGKITAPEDGTFVEVNISSSLIKMAARITKDSEPEVASILEGLKSIRVNVLEFDDDKGDAIKARVRAIRKQMDDQEWERVVTVKEDDTDVGIYAKLKGDEAIEGLVVTVLEDGTAVLAYVDGTIRPEQLAQVGEALNLPPLAHIGEMLNDSM